MTKERKLLRRAEELILVTNDGLELKKEIRTYLFTHSDDAEEPEAEPVAWFEYAEHADAWFLSYRYNPNAKTKPLYLHPPKPAELVTDEILEQHIEESDGRWTDGEFRIDGPDLMSLLRAVSKPAKPEADEPVGWVAFNLESNCYMWSYIYFDSKGRDLGWGSKYELRPIYSHPPRPEPARKPMSVEEIQSLWWEFGIPYSEGEALREIFTRYTRAVERHHLIGGDDE